MLMGSSIWVLVRQSDMATWLILAFLLGMSVVCWAVALYKLMILRKKEQDVVAAINRVAGVVTLEQLAEVGRKLHTTTGGYVITRAVHAVQELLRRSDIRQHGLRYDDLSLLRDELGGAIGELVAHEESYTSLLKTTAEAGPLLGLLGTIWGLIHSFLRMSQEQSADIVTVAPGIAEALITTLMGLLVAIPALLFFHAVSRKLQVYEQGLILLADQSERVIRSALGGALL